jgi:glycosyltransferase involved in cell wall biosynthesis
MSETADSTVRRSEISVVVPIYNEEGSLPHLHQAIVAVCDRLDRLYEVVFIDDGSRDGTPRILKELHAADRHVKVVTFRKNYGQTAAMAAGFEQARGEIIVSMDGDLQNDPVDIPLFLEKLEEGYDVVCGWRKNRQDRFWSRRFPSLIANWIIGRMTGVRIHDNGCSLKAYRSSVIKQVRLYGELHRFIPAMSTIAGARIAEIVVNHHARRFGKSKYGIGRVWKVALDIITVKMITGFGSRPGLWFGLLSLPFATLGVVSLLTAAAMFLQDQIEEWMVLSIVGLLLFFLSAHLIAMAGIGELSWKTGDSLPAKGVRELSHFD